VSFPKNAFVVDAAQEWRGGRSDQPPNPVKAAGPLSYVSNDNTKGAGWHYSVATGLARCALPAGMIAHATIVIAVAAAPALVAATTPARATTVARAVEAALQPRWAVGIRAGGFRACRAPVWQGLKPPFADKSALLTVALEIAPFEIATILSLDKPGAVRDLRCRGDDLVARGKRANYGYREASRLDDCGCSKDD